jgi:hypothetical protein
MVTEELVIISKEIKDLQEIVSYLSRKKSKLFYTSHKKSEKFRNSLLKIKASLFKLKKKITKLSEEKETEETINDFISHIENGEKEAERWTNELLRQYVWELKSLFSKLRGILPEEIKFELDIDLSQVPLAIRNELRQDFAELKSCFLAEAYRGVMMFCGRILETALGRKYFEKTGKDPAEEGWTLGKLIMECKKENIYLQPEISKIAALVNDMRVQSVHRKVELFLPTYDETKGIILLTRSAILRLFSSRNQNEQSFPQA